MNRKPGLSALVRLRDEETWCRVALESIVDWCDEIVIVLNRCSDRTPEIVEAFRSENPAKARVFDYPHEIWPMGPGHDLCPASDPRSSAAFYNFTQSKATRDHAVKWDGDMVAMDWLGGLIREAMLAGHHRITFHGIDIVGDDLRQIGCEPVCWKSSNNGIYQLASGVHYEQGPMTQHLRGVPEPTMTIPQPAFLHFKWARKPFASATVQWPENWWEIPHFVRISERRKPVAEYRGEYPSSVRSLLAT